MGCVGHSLTNPPCLTNSPVVNITCCLPVLVFISQSLLFVNLLRFSNHLPYLLRNNLFCCPIIFSRCPNQMLSFISSSSPLNHPTTANVFRIVQVSEYILPCHRPICFYMLSCPSPPNYTKLFSIFFSFNSHPPPLCLHPPVPLPPLLPWVFNRNLILSLFQG